MNIPSDGNFLNTVEEINTDNIEIEYETINGSSLTCELVQPSYTVCKVTGTVTMFFPANMYVVLFNEAGVHICSFLTTDQERKVIGTDNLNSIILITYLNGGMVNVIEKDS